MLFESRAVIGRATGPRIPYGVGLRSDAC